MKDLQRSCMVGNVGWAGVFATGLGVKAIPLFQIKEKSKTVIENTVKQQILENTCHLYSKHSKLQYLMIFLHLF